MDVQYLHTAELDLKVKHDVFIEYHLVLLQNAFQHYTENLLTAY